MGIKNIVISIGNSDDRLSQKEWSSYVTEVEHHINFFCIKVHFFGGSPNWLKWQNVSWWCEIEEDNLGILKIGLRHIRKYYRQDSAAILVGDTEFV